MKTVRGLTVLALALACARSPVNAQELEVTGFAGASNQSFWQEQRYAEQTVGTQASIQAQLEAYWHSEDNRHRFSLVGFGRYDSVDDERTHVDVREAYWGYEGDSWDIRVGATRVFWGVTESRHLVDVINQTDLVEDIDQEDKLGQAMLNVNLSQSFGRFELYVLPKFRERTFPGIDGRFRPPLPIDPDAAIYESRSGDRHTDYAIRYSQYVGDVDFGVYVFDGTSREPRFVPAPSGGRLLPYYEQMQQVGLDLQLTRGSWLLKLEVIERETRRDTFAAAVGGFEYTLFGVRDSAVDVGLLFEYLYDDRGADSPPTAFDDDVFIGARLALNDANDTSILLGTIVDRQSQSRFVNIEAERRFGTAISAELRLRAFSSGAEGDMLDSFENDDYLQLAANWFF